MQLLGCCDFIDPCVEKNPTKMCLQFLSNFIFKFNVLLFRKYYVGVKIKD